MINLTRGQIIQEGLSQAGRPDLVSNGRLWLNLFLDRIYHNQDFHWLKKSSSGLSATQGSSLPTDYRAGISATFGEEGNVSQLTVLWDSAEFDARRNLLGTQTTDRPTFIFIDEVAKTVQFLPKPESGGVWNLHYYYLPELPDHTDPGFDDDVPLWRANFQILVDEIKAKALEFNDDERQGQAAAGVNAGISENKINNHDRRAGRSRIKLGKQFRNRFD